MPSHAERQKKYLTKLKGRIIGEDQYEEQGSRRRKLKKQENLDLTQEKDRERKKAGKTTITSPAHKTTSTLNRAIRKAESSLPNSP